MVGAGVTGLAAGWEISRSAPEFGLTILEAERRCGGVVRTSTFEGLKVDEASDAFLERENVMSELCRELELDSEIVTPAVGRAAVFLDGQLKLLPRSHFLGVPLYPGELENGLLSSEAVRRLLADLERPDALEDRERKAASEVGDRSVGALIRSRLGDEVAERLVGPLVSTISAGDYDRLSLQALTPKMAAAARSGGSLIRSLRGGGEAAFRSLRGGMERLPETLSRRLRQTIRTDKEAAAIHVRPMGRTPGDSPRVMGVETADGLISCDAVVLCTPAATAGRLIGEWAREAQTILNRIPTASVAIVTLSYDPQRLPSMSEISGFVVPRNEGLTITACSQASLKWPHLVKGKTILRTAVGRRGDGGDAFLPDDELLDRVRADFRTTMGIETAPEAVRISRWPNAFPQYEVGHIARVERVEEELQAAGVFPAGSAYRGIGIEACVKHGRQAAADALDWCSTS